MDRANIACLGVTLTFLVSMEVQINIELGHFFLFMQVKNLYEIFLICSGEKRGGEKNFTKRIRCVARLLERSEYLPRFQDKDLGLTLNKTGEFRDNENCGY